MPVAIDVASRLADTEMLASEKGRTLHPDIPARMGLPTSLQLFTRTDQSHEAIPQNLIIPNDLTQPLQARRPLSVAQDMTVLCSTRSVRFSFGVFGVGTDEPAEVSRGASCAEVRECFGSSSQPGIEPVTGGGDLGDERAYVPTLAGSSQEEGLEGLFDRRLGKASAKRVPVDEVTWVLDQYKTKYVGWTVKHFHDHLRKHHGFRWSYTWTKTQLHAAGLVAQAARGAPAQAASPASGRDDAAPGRLDPRMARGLRTA